MLDNILTIHLPKTNKLVDTLHAQNDTLGENRLLQIEKKHLARDAFQMCHFTFLFELYGNPMGLGLFVYGKSG